MTLFFFGLASLIAGFGLHRFLLQKRHNFTGFSSFRFLSRRDLIIFIVGLIAEILGIVTIIIALLLIG
jgi:hypothetical protein